MSQEQEREEKAFEGLVVDVLQRLDKEDLCIDVVRDPNEEELAALDLLGVDFIDRLVSGKLETKGGEPTEGGDLAMAGEGTSWELFRCDGVDDAVNEKLKKADEEIIKRKGRKDGETS